MEPVLGPRRTSSSISRSSATAASASTLAGQRGGDQLLQPARRPAADLLSRCTRRRSGRCPPPAPPRCALKVTGQPARACSASAALGPARQRHALASPAGRTSATSAAACAGAVRARRRGGWRARCGSQRTIASMAVCRLHRLGPRSADAVDFHGARRASRRRWDVEGVDAGGQRGRARPKAQAQPRGHGRQQQLVQVQMGRSAQRQRLLGRAFAQHDGAVARQHGAAAGLAVWRPAPPRRVRIEGSRRRRSTAPSRRCAHRRR